MARKVTHFWDEVFGESQEPQKEGEVKDRLFWPVLAGVTVALWIMIGILIWS